MNNSDALTQWDYDNIKKITYRHYSTCCGAEVTQKRMLDGVVDDKPFRAATITPRKVKESKIVYKKIFWIFYIKRTVVHETVVRDISAVTPYQYRYFCTKCNKQNESSWDFKHSVEEGTR